MLSLGVAQTGAAERAAALVRDASDTFEPLADDWGIAATGLIRGIGAAHAGDLGAVVEAAALARRHSEAIGYEAFLVPALLLEAWAAERAGDAAAADEALRLALELGG
jgi:hypothetical protein